MFASIIASADKSLSKDKFLASIESSNTSSTVSFDSRKIGRNRETARRTLEMPYEIAVPPLSPPVMDGELENEA